MVGMCDAKGRSGLKRERKEQHEHGRFLCSEAGYRREFERGEERASKRRARRQVRRVKVAVTQPLASFPEVRQRFE